MIFKAIILSAVVASISFFVSHTQLLESQRRWIWKRCKFFGVLVECCYCLGHWVAVVVLAIFPVRLFDAFWPADYIMTWLVISWAAGLQSLVATRLWGE